MKKLVSLLCVLILVVALGTGLAYAWYASIYRGTFGGVSLSPNEAQESAMGVNSSITGTFSASANLGQQSSLNPSTTIDGVSFKTKGGENSTDFLAFNGYMRVPTDTSTFRVSEITLTGNDEINKALRVAVTFNGERKIFAPVQGADGNVSICSTLGEDFSTGCTANTPTLVNFIVWYEGTDSSATAVNANSAKGTNISILVESE